MLAPITGGTYVCPSRKALSSGPFRLDVRAAPAGVGRRPACATNPWGCCTPGGAGRAPASAARGRSSPVSGRRRRKVTTVLDARAIRGDCGAVLGDAGPVPAVYRGATSTGIGPVPLSDAGENALQRSAHTGAVTRLTQGIARCWREGGRRPPSAPNKSLVLQVALGPALMVIKIYGWFTEGFETADLQEARLLLAELAE